MRRFFILATLIVITLAALGSTGGFALAETGPFRSGNILFPLQRFAEETRVWATSNKTGKASYLLDLADRRVLDLATQAGKPGELRALENLNIALDQAMAAVAAVPLEDLGPLKTRLSSLVGQMQVILAMLSITPAQAPDQYAAMQAKITAIGAMLASSDAPQSPSASVAPGALVPTAVPGVPQPTVDPQAVAFPPGSTGALHAFFPLTGVHATVGCQGCHGNGVYTGTPSQCEACHADVKPANHFTGDCAACHSTTAWKPAKFDHQAAGATDCQSCHADKKPANHFTGQCSACHNTSAWLPASFNHQAAGATDCQSCHADKKPANHFTGQCSACHNTSAWLPAGFNHQVLGRPTANRATQAINLPTTSPGSARPATTPAPGGRPASTTGRGDRLPVLPHRAISPPTTLPGSARRATTPAPGGRPASITRWRVDRLPVLPHQG